MKIMYPDWLCLLL